MIKSPFDDHIKPFEAPFFEESDGSKKLGSLLWGDGVQVLGAARNGRVPVRARGRQKKGWVKKTDLGGESLLELYFIDVGQGDGVLIKTPDFRHIMIDGGYPREVQNTGKSAADFVDWKFYHDYCLNEITLDAMIASHNDYDHYGGLADLLDVAQVNELDAGKIRVDAFYHAGISWWLDAGERTLGKESADGKFYIQLLGDRSSAEAATGGGRAAQLQGEWRNFIEKVVTAKDSAGKPTPISRISEKTKVLPDFNDNVLGKGPKISVLGPVEFTSSGKPALLKLGSAESKTTNGNSILLRLDYDRSRILLTGDLNKESQQAILDSFAGNKIAFQCDVAKACHHGSDDVSFAFLKAMGAAATIISSGDNEGHDHPRPAIVAASGASGYVTIEDDEVVTPLVYSTEIARSVALAEPVSLEVAQAGSSSLKVEGENLAKTKVHYKYKKAGEPNFRKGSRNMTGKSILADLIYGLVNVRTDGKTILAATMDEKTRGGWQVKHFKSRF